MATLTKSLKTDIRTRLKTILSDVIPYGTQPVGTPTAYIVYKFINKRTGDNDTRASKTMTLQLDLWYTKSDQDITVIDGYADDIEELLNEQAYCGTDFSYYGVLLTRQDQLPTADENTYHTQLLFELEYDKF